MDQLLAHAASRIGRLNMQVGSLLQSVDIKGNGMLIVQISNSCPEKGQLPLLPTIEILGNWDHCSPVVDDFSWKRVDKLVMM